MATRNLTAYDATPAVADALGRERPVLYTERKARLGEFCGMHEWAVQTHGYRRIAELFRFDPQTHPATVGSGRIEGDDELRPEFVAAGAVCCVYLCLPVSAETAAAGGGANVSVVGLSADGCRAILYHGGEWVPTADGLYPWPTTANAL